MSDSKSRKNLTQSRRNRFKPDPEYHEIGGWKVHLTVGPALYNRRTLTVKRWLRKNFEGEERFEWKHLEGGDKHQKDFTIYLGSHATLTSFVSHLESDPIVEQLDASNAGSSDRIVGSTGKVSARFDPRGRKAGSEWFYGRNGISFPLEDQLKVLARKNTQAWADAEEHAKAVLREIFGDYFMPKDID